jgi:hypothetical protein
VRRWTFLKSRRGIVAGVGALFVGALPVLLWSRWCLPRELPRVRVSWVFEHASRSPVVSGRISDRDGRPVAGGRVETMTSSGTNDGVTNTDGRFVIALGETDLEYISIGEYGRIAWWPSLETSLVGNPRFEVVEK